MIIYNTASRRVEDFKPITSNFVGIYTCGPTVYGEAHIGNLRTYIFEDVLRRTLEYSGFQVKHVMNITDVGHLTSDADEGEDKLQMGAKREGTNAWSLAKKYTDLFMNDTRLLNILPAHIICKATDHISEQIDMIKTLEKKGYTYNTADGVYFDTSKFEDYPKFARLDVSGLRGGARIEISDEKRSKTDFALWKFSKREEKRDMEWDSPWGIGFPGWHIECSAMSLKYLGPQFDIHAGGIDHVAIHHTNEIAQTQCATGITPSVKYWVHGEFLVLDNNKMSKSQGSTLTIRTLIDKGYDPLAYRYLCLGSSYRKQLSFSWEALDGAQASYRNLKTAILALEPDNMPAEILHPDNIYLMKFKQAVQNDMNTPVALAVVWSLLKDPTLPNLEKYATLLNFDQVLGLDIINWKEQQEEIPAHILELASKRQEMRTQHRWAESDILRDQILDQGYTIMDSPTGPTVKKKNSRL